MTLARELGAGGISCAIVSSIFNPLDVTKVRLQTQSQLTQNPSSGPMYRSFRHCVTRIVAEEGILGLWTPGLAASVL